MRLQTVSVAPPMPKRVPEGDMKKINAMSWLLDNPDTHAEAAVQVNGPLALLFVVVYGAFSGLSNFVPTPHRYAHIFGVRACVKYPRPYILLVCCRLIL